MPGTSAPQKPAIEERDGGHPSPRSGRQRSSIFGLSIVSGLNVACLAFIAYHFAAHPRDAKVAPNVVSGTTDMMNADANRPMEITNKTASDVLGNVDLAPASKQVISIASGFDLTDMKPADRRENVSLTSTEFEESDADGVPGTGEPSRHWVQLGALSKEATARRYWSALKLRHGSLLRERVPRYFGPTEVGGGLYHIRLGPMAAHAASRLCKRLAAEGADCFCVSPDDDASRYIADK